MKQEVHHIFRGVAYPVTGKNSALRRGRVRGVGVNDAEFITQPRVCGQRHTHPVYQVWVNMLRRCYAPTAAQARVYGGCSVDPRWLSFRTFWQWYMAQPLCDGLGVELDHNLLLPGNTVYAPEVCILIPGAINLLLSNKPGGILPQGVKRAGCLYRAQIQVGEEVAHLGVFPTPAEAHCAWQDAKRRRLISLLPQFIDHPTIYNALADAAAFIAETYPTKEST